MNKWEYKVLSLDDKDIKEKELKMKEFNFDIQMLKDLNEAGSDGW